MESELVFLAGTWKNTTYSNQDLQRSAEAYNKARVTAPWVVGHDINPGDPAAGWIRSLTYTESPEGIGQLWAESDFNALGLKLQEAQTHGNKSISFYPPESPYNPVPGTYFVRHVAMLGAEMPALTGLGMIGTTDFASELDDDELLTYSCPCSTTPTNPSTTLTMTDYEKLAAQIASLTAKIEAAMEDEDEVEDKASEPSFSASDDVPDYKALYEATKAKLDAATVSTAGSGIARQVESYYSDGLLSEEAISARDLTTCLTKLELGHTDFSATDAPATVIEALIAALQDAKPAISIPTGEETATESFSAAPNLDGELDDKFYTQVDQIARQHNLSFSQGMDTLLAAQALAQETKINLSEAIAAEANRYKVNK